MKKLLLSLCVAASAFGANVDVQKVSGTNAITAPLVFGTGQTLEIASGATLSVDAGATFNLGSASIAWSAITGKPTTLAGYGITDPIVLTTGTYDDPSWLRSLSASKLTTGTIPVAQLPALTGGDATTTSGSGVITLAQTGVGAGSVGAGNAIPVITFDAKGRATVKATTPVTPVFSSITGTPTSAAGYGITNGAAIDMWGTKTPPTGAIVGTSDTQTLTNKTYDGLTFATTTGFTATGGGKTLTVSNTANVSGTNTGDQTITLTGDATGTGTGAFAVNVGKINGIPLSGLATGILKNTTSTGVPSIATAGTDYDLPVVAGTGLTRNINTLSVNASQIISFISNLGTNGFVKTGGGTGALSVDTNTYITGNQTITLSGDVTGSGTTAITAAVGNLPTGVTVAGNLLHSNVVAPSTPAAGKVYVYTDSTSKNLAAKNDAGVINHGVQTQTSTANSFITAIADNGAVTVAQPSFTNLSGSVAATQMPAFTGDATTSAGATVTSVGKVNGVSYGASPGTNTVPVVTSTNTITYEAVPNAALANSSITIQGSSVALGGTALATTATPQFARIGLGAAADTTAQVLAENDTLGATSTDGVILKNATAATAGNQKWSPRLRMTGQGWQTGTSGSQPVDFIQEMRPVQGTSNPTGKWVLASQINGGGYVDQMTVDTNGNAIYTGNISALNLSLGGIFTTSAALTFTGAATVTLNGNPTLNDWFDQSVKTTASPTFVKATFSQTTGTAPFTVSSTTNVANLNASSLGGATFAAPGAIGGTTPGTAAFTTLAASGTVSGAGFSTYLASPPAIGGTAPNAGTFTGETLDSGTGTYPSIAPDAATNQLRLFGKDSSLGLVRDSMTSFGNAISLNGVMLGGTRASPVATPGYAANNNMFRIELDSWDGVAGATYNNATYDLRIDGLQSSSNHGGYYNWVGVPNGSTAAGNWMQLKSAILAITSPIGGIGYTTGAGSAVTQTTSRTTGVTLNNPTGAITLVSAAGTASYQTFTVTDSTVAAADVIACSLKTGTTDKYIITTTAAAGSFQITYATTGGTTTEQPVFNFVILKGSNS